MSAVPPIRRQVLVAADPLTAFEAFTARIGRWWPLAEHGLYGAGATVAFVDGEIVERSTDGARALWGTVTRWEPGRAVAFTWHPGATAQRASQVEVTFVAAETETLVTLEHRGWDVFDDPAGARADYDEGWPGVLERYDRHVERSAGNEDAETWVALFHRRGPAAPPTGAVFDDPRFAGHVAFLTRMRDAGYLVAAGPLSDADGEGMTVLRLPGNDSLEEATRLARQDDASVANGFFTVTVRPWEIVLQESRR